MELDGKKHMLVMRMDLTEQYRAKMANKILSVSLPSFKAYTWYTDLRDGIINYGEALLSGERNLNELNTMEKFIQYIHDDDCDSYYKEFNKLAEQESEETGRAQV